MTTAPDETGPAIVAVGARAAPGWCVEPVLDLAGRRTAVTYDPDRHTVVWFMQPPNRDTAGRMAADGWQRIAGDTDGELWALDRVQRERSRLTNGLGLQPPAVA